MRNCKKCNTGLEERNTYKSDFNAGRNICKPCRKNRNVEYYAADSSYKRSRYYANPEKHKAEVIENRKKYEDGNHHVYLRKDNYVGVTKNGQKRSYEHKGILCLLHSTPNRKNALELEELLHDLGYKGRHNNYRYA
jgi:hypothetical protein